MQQCLHDAFWACVERTAWAGSLERRCQIATLQQELILSTAKMRMARSGDSTIAGFEREVAELVELHRKYA
jgi:hypothetical protein